MKKISYSKQTLETPNPIARFAHKKRYEFSFRKTLQFLNRNGVLLDYGCGKGDFLNRISDLRPSTILYGFDPESGHASEKYDIISNIKNIDDQAINVVCCFETLEHLYEHERANFYSETKRMLSNSGIVIISVPIIGGLTLLFKEINRMMLFKRKSEYTVKELLLSSLFGKPAQKPENPRLTHKGFDFSEVEKELRSNFKLIEKSYSPFPMFPWWQNSQVFFVCSKQMV